MELSTEALEYLEGVVDSVEGLYVIATEGALGVSGEYAVRNVLYEGVGSLVAFLQMFEGDTIDRLYGDVRVMEIELEEV